MVAQTSSAGGDCAPRKVRITFAVTIDVTVEPLPPATGEAQGNPPTPEPGSVVEFADVLSYSAIQWLALLEPEEGMVSADGRFLITAPAPGAVDFIVTDIWTGERRSVFDGLRAAVNWCRGRLAGVPLLWAEDGAGWKAERDGPILRVTRGGDHFRSKDCRFTTEHKSRFSPHFDSLETAQRWCEVRAACRIGGEHATLHYVAPGKPQS